ncbi:MAG: alpha/beta fold hydrolase [Marmoricola sp.]
MTLEDTSEVEVGGVPLRVRITGPEDGVPLLLIHGVVRSLEDWAEAQDLLADAGFRVISTDLPGFGLSRRGRERPGLASFARSMAGLIDALGINRPVHLVGNSLGGGVSMTLAVQDPTKVASLTLVNSVGFGVEANVSALPMLYGVLGTLPFVGRSFRRRAREAGIQAIRDIFFDPELATPEQLKLAGVLSRQRDFRATFLGTAASLGGAVLALPPALGQRPGWRRALIAGVAATGIPTLIVWGDADKVLPPSHYEAARAALPDAQSHLFGDTGHMPQVEKAAEFAALVGEFVAKVDAAR